MALAIRDLALREVRRGEASDELDFILSDGSVLIAHAHGLHADEQLRVREALLKVLSRDDSARSRG
jgi:hypothetical protein